jgi:zinc transporter ZupT
MAKLYIIATNLQNAHAKNIFLLMEVFLLSVFAAIAALAGGYIAIASRERINLALGFTAGVILGVVAFDLLPEIFNISNRTSLDIMWPMVALVSGFLVFHIVEKAILLHNSNEEQYGPHQHPNVGMAGAVALCGHSFLDGLSIGVAFQVNTSVGVAVAVAVIAHRFADGFNTTNIMLFHKNKITTAKKMLYIAALMPILGGLSTLYFDFSESVLAIYLGFFAGFLLYIGASDILPQAHSKNSSRTTIATTVFGTIFMFLITCLR